MPPRFSPEAYVATAREEIANWEKPKRSYLSALGDFALNPAASITVRAIPQTLQKAASQAIEKALVLAAQAGGLSVDAKSVFRERAKLIGRKRLLGSRLQACDQLAKRFWSNHWKYAAAQGAATGLAGWSGLIADIPLLLSIALREIRLIGLCYGYGISTADEIEYALHVLRIGVSREPKVREESLSILKNLENRHSSAQADHSEAQVFRSEEIRVRYLVTIQQYARSLAVDMIRRSALQLIPLAGVLTGASANAACVHDVGRAAHMCYRRRFLLEGANS